MRLQRRHPRRGIVLLIVMAMLALFAGVALGFVFYAEGEATVARIGRDAERSFAPDVDPEMLLSYYLSQLIYDADDNTGIYSALRGHGLARNIYGYNSNNGAFNTTPFNGTGRLSYQVALGGLGNFDNKTLINYQYYSADGFLRDPERLNTRANNSAAQTQFVGEANPPYTYPDLNNVYLGAVNANGEVIARSYHRINQTGGSLTGNNSVDRYRVLRPHPVYNFNPANPTVPTFPAPEDGGGDVKNLDWAKGVPNGAGGYFVNDSYWLDAGFPTLVAPDGRKYKALFAPFVMDLDNRLNLMVAGNFDSVAKAHRSNQGFGRHEINLNYYDSTMGSAIGAKYAVVNPADLPGLIQGYRYGNGNPDGSNPDLPTTNYPYPCIPGTPQKSLAPYYSAFDFDAKTVGNLTIPAAGTPTAFPTYPVDWASGVNETQLHPAGYSYWFALPGGTDLSVRYSAGSSALPPRNLEALLRFGGKNSPAVTSDLFAMLPNTLNPTSGQPTPRAMNLLTTLSASFDRPNVVPYVTYDNTVANATPPYNLTGAYPQANPPLTFPTPGTALPANSDFGTEWRRPPTYAQAFSGTTLPLPKLDLNRPLTDYPAPDPKSGQIDLTIAKNVSAVNAAISDRQTFAKDIFNRLVLATGATTNSTDASFPATRWLAQIAVNIVDYIDNDDYRTPFDWKGDQSEILFGTELPRLVLNEVYAQFDNDPANDPGLQNGGTNGTYYNVNLWAEFYNLGRLTTDAYPRDGGNVNLITINSDGSNCSVYKLKVCSQKDPNIRAATNFTGVVANNLVNEVNATDWATAASATIQPGDGAAAPQGFFLVGPNAQYLAGRNPNFPASSVSTANMVIAKQVFPAMGVAYPKPALYLQRLANEHLPYDNNPANVGTTYNPYITVDYVEDIPNTNNGIVWQNMVAQNPPAVDNFSTWGKTQPLRALSPVPQTPAPALVGKAQNTFFAQNNPQPNAWEWVVHLDRQLINPLELLHVSCYRPHELTQLVQPGNQAQIAPWVGDQLGLPNPGALPTQQTLLYRFLEYTTTRDRGYGNMLDGRAPGKININTVWDPEILLALADPQSFSNFTPTQIYDPTNAAANLYKAMRISRDNDPNGLSTGQIIGNTPRPFMPLGVGINPGGGVDPQFPQGLGIDSTLFRNDASTGKPMFLLNTMTHPYQKLELLRKLFNNVTTTSNCFAVWVTVGFFEVVDDTVRPPRLGEEIGRRDNRNTRHRFFAIIDRSEIAVTRSQLSANVAAGKGVNIAVPASAIVNNASANFTYQPGMPIEIVSSSAPLTSEVVRIQSATLAGATWTLVVDLANAHNAGDTVIVRGNPGPWPRYSVRNDPLVVPHYAVID